MVFVKTVVYHALGTSMPYPLGDPPATLAARSIPNGCAFISVLLSHSP